MNLSPGILGRDRWLDVTPSLEGWNLRWLDWRPAMCTNGVSMWEFQLTWHHIVVGFWWFAGVASLCVCVVHV